MHFFVLLSIHNKTANYFHTEWSRSINRN